MIDEEHSNGHMSIAELLRREAWQSARDIDENVFSRIEHILERRGITLRQVSRDLKLPYRSLQNWAHGRSTCPTDVVRRMSAYLGVEADYLLFGSIDIDAAGLVSALGKLPPQVLNCIVLAFEQGAKPAQQIQGRSSQQAAALAIRRLAAGLRVEYLRHRHAGRILQSNGYVAPGGRYDATGTEDVFANMFANGTAEAAAEGASSPKRRRRSGA